MLWIILVLLLFVSQTAVIIISEYGRPHKAVAWLVIVYTLPLIGFLFYYFMAKEYTCLDPAGRKDDSMFESTKEFLTDRCKRRFTVHRADPLLHLDDGLHAIFKNGNPLPITACNETTVYIEGERAFEAMLESIALAKHHIHIEFFIIRNDALGTRFRQLLIQKAQEKVKVRLLYDGVGCRSLRKTFLKRLENAGVEIGCFSPPLSTFLNKRINYRNHRKIVVVDGEVGFIGGLNIGDEYLGNHTGFGYWRDTHFKMKGDAVLWIQYTFLTDWYDVKKQLLTAPVYYPVQESQGNEFIQIVKSSPDQPILELIFSFIVSAKKRLYIETPYFIPDPSVLLALKTAAIRGVDVRVIIPAVPDSKLVYFASLSYVRELLQAGIRFYRFRKGFIHAKVMISDDTACSGSANMDMRSLTGQFEINAIFFDGKVVNRLVQDFDADLSVSDEMVLSEFENRSGILKIKEIFARLLSPLF